MLPMALAAIVVIGLGYAAWNYFHVKSRASSEVVVVAAGDISCDPASSSYNGGNGTSTECHMKQTADLVTSINPAAVLTLGDLQYQQGSLTQFQTSYANNWGVAAIKNITKPAPGNHEYETSGASGYYGYFGSVAGSSSKGYYSYNLGNWHLMALNSNCSYVSCAAGSAQETWLKSDLTANQGKCLLAYWHHPRYSSGQHGNDTNVSPLVDALLAAQADVVLNGHDHDYERFHRQNNSGTSDTNGIRFFVVGTGGKSLYSFGAIKANSASRNNTVYGVLKLNLKSTSYTWTFMPEAGQSFTDTGSTDCHLYKPASTLTSTSTKSQTATSTKSTSAPTATSETSATATNQTSTPDGQKTIPVISPTKKPSLWQVIKYGVGGIFENIAHFFKKLL
jgi:acid phosphatase type 7